MRALHVTHQYKPAIGGSEQYMTDLSEELAKREHRVDVFTTRSQNYLTWRNELSSFERLDRVNVYRFPSLERKGYTWRILDFGYRNYRRTGSPVYEPFIFFGNGPLSPLLFTNLVLKGRRYDVVHLNTLPYSHVYYSYLCARLLRVPVVVTPHIHVDQPETFDVGYFNAVLRGSDLVIADTELEKRYLIARGVHEDKIMVGGIGIKLENFELLKVGECRRCFRIPEEAFVLLFLGRKVGYKGLETILRAFTILREYDAVLYLVAAGPETHESQVLQASYNDMPGFINLGAVSHQEKVMLLNACDVLLLPSRAEAFGIVFLEAWAVKKPVIGARSGAIPAVIAEEVDGLLIEPGDAVGLARQIKRLINDPALKMQLGAKGYQKVLARYTVERIADIVEQSYFQLLHRTSERG